MDDTWINLSDWTLWITADDYAWGSFMYSEGIDSKSSTKWFSLGPQLVEWKINKRNSAETNALCYKTGIWLLSFSNDWYIETDDTYVFSPNRTWTTAWGGLYRRSSWYYKNGTVIWDTIIWISSTGKIDRITNITWLRWSNIVSNPWLTSNTWWTVWSWWTTWATWAVHTSGTAALKQTITTDWTSKNRIVIRMEWCTTWSCSVKLWAVSLGTLTSNSDIRSLFVWTSIATSEEIILTPSNTFNGTIQYVIIEQYDMTKLLPDNITINQASEHPILLWQGDVYIWSGDKIDIVNTTLWDVRTVSIIDVWYVIKSITQIGWSLIVWASSWDNSKQYYWDWVSVSASEVIDWNGMDISNAICDESKTYVMTGGQSNNPRLYLVSWYNRELLAKNDYDGGSIWYNYKKYNPAKKFNFYNYNSNSMSILNESLYVPAYGGMYSYGNKVPWMKDVWSKEVIFDTEWWNIMTASACHWWYLYLATTKDTLENVIYYVKDCYNCRYWYGITPPIIWDKLSSRKSLNNLKLGYYNVDKSMGNIKIYTIVDDYYFWTFYVSWVTTSPLPWDVYKMNGNYIEMEVISTDITAWVWSILFKTIKNTFYWWGAYVTNLTKVSWLWDTTITIVSYTNMALIKTIESDNQWYGDELIFGKSFVDTHMPNRHKIQFVIELNVNLNTVSSVIYDISINSDIVEKDI